MATPAPSQFTFGFIGLAPSSGSATFNQIDIAVGASKYLNYGDLVTIDATSGLISQALAAPSASGLTAGQVTTSSAFSASDKLYGVCLDSIATNASSIDSSSGFNRTTIPVAIFDGNLQICLRLIGATSSAAPVSTYTSYANSFIGEHFQIVRVTGYGGNNTTGVGTCYALLAQNSNTGGLLAVAKYSGYSDTATFAPMWVKEIGTLRSGSDV
jgi:hypothetical protein